MLFTFSKITYLYVYTFSYDTKYKNAECWMKIKRLLRTMEKYNTKTATLRTTVIRSYWSLDKIRQLNRIEFKK